MLTVASANVNGIRAAVRRGMGPWLDTCRPDVLCLQEVRAPDEAVTEALGDGWHVVHEEAATKGRAGVAVASRVSPVAVRVGLNRGGLDAATFDDAGRWVEADVLVDGGLLTAVSVYVHTGEARTPRQVEKEAFLAAMATRMRALAADGRYVVVCGDYNVAHREADLKNWKGNLTKAGFLAQERAWFDDLLAGGPDAGFVDVQRALAGEGPGPYSWWSWRGKAFDLDSGWRIDYQIASANLAACAVSARTDRAATYAERWSDHAPVVVEYDLTARPG